MEVKDGFQKTEVGVIPEEWGTCQLAEAVDFLDGQRRPVKSSDRAKVSGIYPYYGASGVIDFVNDYIFDDNLILLGEDGENILSRNLPLVFQVKGKIWVNNHAHVMKPRDSFHIGFLTDYLESLDFSLLNSGTAQPKLNQQTCRKIIVPKPTIAEQTAIANALNDADALITQLEKLIAKKQAIKQGVMQKLLKPKEGWDFLSFREVSYMKGRIGWQGLKQTEFTMNPDQPFLITGMNFKDGSIRWDEVYHIPEERYEIAKDIQLKKGDVLITKDGTIGKLLYISAIPFPNKATLNSHLLVFRPLNGSYNPKFLYYQLQSKTFKDFIELRKTGTTFFGISQEAVGDYQVFLPKPEEQNFIADTLTAMDAEIEVLEKKLEKDKKIKQGMMQELLTGRIRLV